MSVIARAAQFETRIVDGCRISTEVPGSAKGTQRTFEEVKAQYEQILRLMLTVAGRQIRAKLQQQSDALIEAVRKLEQEQTRQ